MFQDKDVMHIWVPLLLAAVFAYIVAHCFITVYEVLINVTIYLLFLVLHLLSCINTMLQMAIDTIFICFCEDCEQNDGLSRPYFMSRGLMVNI